jgi:hypothetical protein
VPIEQKYKFIVPYEIAEENYLSLKEFIKQIAKEDAKR